MQKIIALKEQDFKDFGVYDYAPANAEDALDSYDKVMEILGEITGDVLAVNAESVAPFANSNVISLFKNTLEILNVPAGTKTLESLGQAIIAH